MERILTCQNHLDLDGQKDTGVDETPNGQCQITLILTDEGRKMGTYFNTMKNMKARKEKH